MVNINLALEKADQSTKIAALLLTLIGACLAGCFAVTVLHDQAYLCAIAWAVAGIAGKMDYRSSMLERDVAAGVDTTLLISWIGLLVVGASNAAFSMFKK